MAGLPRGVGREYWANLSGVDRVAARSRLMRIDDEPDASAA
ncbi:hypothetical protein ACWC9T_32155 [Kitasatospora sp. NPDC001159]